MLALGAGETLPVVAPWLGNLLLSLEYLVGAGVMSFEGSQDLSRAARADICFSFLSLKRAAICVVQVRLRLVTVRVRVAVLAIDLGYSLSVRKIGFFTYIIVRPLGQCLVVQGAFALHALEALAMVSAVPLFRKLWNQQTTGSLSLSLALSGSLWLSLALSGSL